MFETLLVIVCFLLLCSVIIIMLVIRAAENVIGAVAKDVHNAVDGVPEREWRQADAFERERMVRRACCWRVIGRAVGAGALVTSAFVTTSSILTIACCLTAWRLVKPIRQEMRGACTYRSTGAKEEPRYS